MYRLKLKRKIGRFFSKIDVVSHAQKRNIFFCFRMGRKLTTIVSEENSNDLEKKNLTRHQATQITRNVIRLHS